MFRGHVAKSVEIPARPYLGLSKEDERELVERTLDWLRTTGGLK
jgi:phage gpG-like protein